MRVMIVHLDHPRQRRPGGRGGRAGAGSSSSKAAPTSSPIDQMWSARRAPSRALIFSAPRGPGTGCSARRTAGDRPPAGSGPDGGPASAPRSRRVGRCEARRPTSSGPGRHQGPSGHERPFEGRRRTREQGAIRGMPADMPRSVLTRRVYPPFGCNRARHFRRLAKHVSAQMFTTQSTFFQNLIDFLRYKAQIKFLLVQAGSEVSDETLRRSIDQLVRASSSRRREPGNHRPGSTRHYSASCARYTDSSEETNDLRLKKQGIRRRNGQPFSYDGGRDVGSFRASVWHLKQRKRDLKQPRQGGKLMKTLAHSAAIVGLWGLTWGSDRGGAGRGGAVCSFPLSLYQY